MALLKRKATYEDLRQVPDHMVAEILDGDLFASPRPALPHALAASMIGAALITAFGDVPAAGIPGGWWVLFEPELHLGGDVLVPDLAAWRRERLPVIPDAPAMTLAPDWVCEVVSASTGGLDRGRKMRAYAREGVGHLWLIDPSARTLETYRLEGSRWVVLATHSGADTVAAEPFAEIALDMRRWWREP